MHLKLMFITNDSQTARIAQAAGVDRIFVDMEALGKAERQGGMDTVQSHHTAADAARLRPLLDRAELLVRVDPIHDGSQEQIEAVLRAGADVVMLPFFRTAGEVAAFTRIVGGRARTCLLVETPEAVERIDEILAVPGVDECHIGLNDLHLGYRLPFLFQLLADGTVERLCGKFRAAGKPYGFGGFGRPGTGQLPAERIMGGALPPGLLPGDPLPHLLRPAAAADGGGDRGPLPGGRGGHPPVGGALLQGVPGGAGGQPAGGLPPGG